MEIEYRLINLYKTKQYDACLKLYESALHDKNVTSNNKLMEFIRMRIMTIQTKLAGNGYEEVEYYNPQSNELSDTGVAKTPRPGTSFQREIKTALNEKIPTTATLRTASYTASRARTSSSVLSTAARFSRAATALADGSSFNHNVPVSLRFLSKDDKSFVPAAKTLFEYVYYCECNVRKAMEIIFQIKKMDDKSDWWWNYSLARCYSALGLQRNTEECLRQALKQNKHIAIYLRLIAMYVGLNQPLSALDVCKQGDYWLYIHPALRFTTTWDYVVCIAASGILSCLASIKLYSTRQIQKLVRTYGSILLT
ncbi:tetratricopeptide repeat protein 8-like [Leptidea sinapis]|uniref:tetratricopeptide repeat protein 8-like n=1 Tax=Leptidea sinapis TaxID=189913 RepID=UPI0021C285D2|nr:tetratricopeptide repeat protein 8-like [Leptidea sinapis]